MIVESQDGYFYKNPIIQFDKWMLEVNDDGVFVKRKGKMTWKTARGYLRGGGVKCRYVGVKSDTTAILGSRLVNVSVFEVELKGPIPTPQTYESKFTLVPSEEMEGQQVVKWRKS